MNMSAYKTMSAYEIMSSSKTMSAYKTRSAYEIMSAYKTMSAYVLIFSCTCSEDTKSACPNLDQDLSLGVEFVLLL